MVYYFTLRTAGGEKERLRVSMKEEEEEYQEPQGGLLKKKGRARKKMLHRFLWDGGRCR